MPPVAEVGAATRALLNITSDGGDDRPLAQRICQACVTGLDVDGAALSLLTATVSRATLWATDATAELLEELQFSLNEGACMEAALTGRPAPVPDLHHSTETARWPTFAAAVAEQTSVRALFALPLQWGTVKFGVLDLYREVAGGLSAGQYRDAITTVDTAALMMLDQRTRSGARRRAGGATRTGPTAGSGWTSRRGITRRSTRPPGWCSRSSGSAPPRRWRGCAGTRSPNSACSSTSPVTWCRGGCDSPTT